MNNCSRYRTPWQQPAEAGEPACAVLGSKHHDKCCAINLALARKIRAFAVRNRHQCVALKRLRATANILSATRLPAKIGRPLVLRPSLTTGLPFRG